MNTTNNEQFIEKKPIYQRPTVTTYSAEELLDLIGPVQAGSAGGDNNPMGGGPGAMGPIHKIIKVI